MGVQWQPRQSQLCLAFLGCSCSACSVPLDTRNTGTAGWSKDKASSIYLRIPVKRDSVQKSYNFAWKYNHGRGRTCIEKWTNYRPTLMAISKWSNSDDCFFLCPSSGTETKSSSWLTLSSATTATASWMMTRRKRGQEDLVMLEGVISCGRNLLWYLIWLRLIW